MAEKPPIIEGSPGGKDFVAYPRRQIERLPNPKPLTRQTRWILLGGVIAMAIMLHSSLLLGLFILFGCLWWLKAKQT